MNCNVQMNITGVTVTSFDKDFYPPVDYRTIVYCHCPQTVLIRKPGIYQVDDLQFNTLLSEEQPIKQVRLFSSLSRIKNENGRFWIDDNVHNHTDCDIIVFYKGEMEPVTLKKDEIFSVEEEKESPCLLL